MRLGVFGGSFQPPHRGHRIAAEAFCQAAALDHLLIIPAGIPPHKTLPQGGTNAQRLAMTRLNFEGLATPHTVSDREIRRQGPSYTLLTLSQLKNEYPEAELFLYCGSDMLTSFHTWYEYQKILSLCTLCVMKREDCVPQWDEALHRLNQLSPRPILTICAPHYEESSSHLREQLKNKQVPAGLLPAVADYIKKEGLYQ